MGVYVPPNGKKEMSYTDEQVVVTPVNTGAQQGTAAQVFDNHSSKPTTGVEKVGDNIHTISGVKLDNKTVGTNAGKDTVSNYINGFIGDVFSNGVKEKEFQEKVAEAQQRANTNYAQNITDYMAQNRIGNAENRAAVGNMNAQRTDKINSNPDYSQYANDDLARTAAFYAQYGVDPDIDIEVEIDKYRNAHPVLTAEDAAILQQLLKARDAKIGLNPELEQYRNSYGTEQANNALRGHDQENVIKNAYDEKRNTYNQMSDLTDEYVALMKAEAERFRDKNIKNAEAEALEQRRNLMAMSPIADLALQEELSQMGLTRGANNSSGYGENARLMAQLNTSNQVAEINKQLDKSRDEYNNAYLDAIMEAERTGLSQKMDVQKLIAEVGPEAALALIEVENTKIDRENAIRDFYEKQRQFNLGYGLDSRRTDAEITHMGNVDALARDQFDYQKQYDANNFGLKTLELFGEVVDEDLAELLGVPVGTKTLEAINSAKELVIAEKNAEASMMNARTNESEAMLNKMVNIWEATGMATPEVAAYFGVPEGTTLYKYVHEINKAKSSNSGSKSGGNNTNLELPKPGDNIVIDANAKYYTLDDGSKVNMINAETGPVTKKGFEDALNKVNSSWKQNPFSNFQ